MMFSVACGEVKNPSSPLVFSGNFCSSIVKAKKYGFDAIEIHTPDIENLDVESVIATCKCENMKISTIGTGAIYGKYGLSLMDQEIDKHERIINMVKKYIDVAERVKSKVTIGSIKGNVPKNACRDIYIETLGSSLKNISDYAVQKGVIVLLEATNRYENNVINTGSDILNMIEKYSLENVMGLMDSFHMNIEEESISNGIFALGKYLGHVHIADNTRLYPGSGSFNWNILFEALKKCGYNSYLSIECLPIPSEEECAKKSIEFFQGFFG